MSALFETWTLKQEPPEPFARIVRERGGKRTSVKEKDCSTYNTGKAKSATLHAPTLWAILGLIDLMGGWGSGAAGFKQGTKKLIFWCWSTSVLVCIFLAVMNTEMPTFDCCTNTVID